MPYLKLIIASLFLLISQQTYALGNEELLTPDQAFKISTKLVSDKQIEVIWTIADGYYLYRNKTSFSSATNEIKLGSIDLPKGKSKHDEFFGETEIFRDQFKVSIPVINPVNLPKLNLLAKYQGCADIGICYPPQKKTISVNLSTTEQSQFNPLKQLTNGVKSLGNSLFQQPLLPAEQAFQFFATVKDANTLQVNWLIADDYYLYRDKIDLSINDKSVQLANYTIPKGKPYHDEAFGDVQIFHNELNFDVPLVRTDLAAQTITLSAKYQGCAEIGVCYPPMDKSIALQLPVASQQSLQNKSAKIDTNTLSEQDQILYSLKNSSLWITLVSFFGFGLLLAFTPCIFPMIPILSGIIVGQGPSVTTRKAFLLSLCYVLASALTYTVFGVLAALFGGNLQATFQQPWIIILFSSIFVLLSFSMFGFYNLELPKYFQAKLHNSSEKFRDKSYFGAAIMGALSSLVVGPCVAAPLAGALIYIGQTGDVVLGGSALFVMGLAMGTPLLLLGASAGSLLPKAGQWLNSTKALFGVIMLAVSVWMLERILPISITMLLTAALLIIPAVYLRAIDPLPEHSSGWLKLWKGLAVMMLIYGILLVIGVSMGSTKLLQPLSSLGSLSSNKTAEHGLAFQTISSTDDLDKILEQAKQNNQWVMLDFYADWCISCKEMEAFTFTDSQVQQSLANFILIQADVTKNSIEDKALLNRFNLFGPPAIIFYGPDKQERTASRVIGYQNSDTFLATISGLKL